MRPAQAELTFFHPQFMHAMKAFLSCDSSIVRARTPARLLDANEFLFIVTETYHKSSAPFPSTANCEHSFGGAPRVSPNHRSVLPSAFDTSQKKTFALSGLTPASVYPPDTPSSTGAALLDDNEDDDEAQLQSRLGSLLERMKKRQQVSGS